MKEILIGAALILLAVATYYGVTYFLPLIVALKML